MSYTECLNTFRQAAGRDVPDSEVDDFLTAFEAHKRYLRSREVLSDDELNRRAASELAQKLEIAAIIERRNAAINYTKRLEKVGWVLNTFGRNPALGLETLLAGSQRAKDGARSGVMQIQATMQKTYLAGFARDLEGTGHYDLFSSGAMDRDVARALWAMDQPDMAKVHARLPKEAREIAEVIRKWQEVTRLDANAAGAWVGKRNDYIVRQSHDSERIRRAGEGEWMAAARQAFDIPKMMQEHGAVDERAMLQLTYQNLATGNHLKEAPEDVASGFKGPGNLAKKLSQSRTILFKDADAWHDYNERFGTGNLRESVTAGLGKSAQSIGAMRVLGTNPLAMFDAIRDDVVLQLKSAGRLEDVVKIDGKEREYQRYLDNIDGTANIPGNAMGARYSANVRAWTMWAKLGGMVLSQLNDVAVYGSGARYQGRGFFSGMTEAVSGLGRSLAPQDRRDLAASLGVVLDNMAAEMGRAGSFAEGGDAARITQLFMKANLSTWWTNRMRTSAAFGMSHHMALQAGKGFDALGDDYQRVLSLYGIGKAEWDVVRQAAQKQVDGKLFITPDDVVALSDDVIRGYAGPAVSDAAVARARRDLAEKVRTYFVDQTETLALEPDVKTRAIMLQSLRPGTFWGELARFMAQFKSFTGAYLQRVLGREIYGRGYEGDSLLGALRNGNGEMIGLAQLIVTSTLMGYASMALKDLAKGREPRDPTESPAQAAKVVAAALVQGGGLGIYGDFLFGEASRFGGGTIESLAGPVLSTAGRLIDIYHKAIHGDDVAASVFNEALNNTPFLNLFYTRAALNYLVLYRMQESMNPGYLRRMERTMERENGQTFMIPPSSVVN